MRHFLFATAVGGLAASGFAYRQADAAGVTAARISGGDQPVYTGTVRFDRAGSLAWQSSVTVRAGASASAQWIERRSDGSETGFECIVTPTGSGEGAAITASCLYRSATGAVESCGDSLLLGAGGEGETAGHCDPPGDMLQIRFSISPLSLRAR